MTDIERGTKREILKNGKIATILTDGTYIINGHVSLDNGKEIYVINGFKFNPNDGFNVTVDHRKI
jgi:hypothetical protein